MFDVTTRRLLANATVFATKTTMPSNTSLGINATLLTPTYLSQEEYLALQMPSLNGTEVNGTMSATNDTFYNHTVIVLNTWYPSGYSAAHIILASVVVTVLMIMVVVGNMLVIIAIATEKALKNIQNWFIASLAVADFLIGLAIMPFSLANELMGYWIFGFWWCEIHSAMDVLLCTSSIMNLCLISLDRYWSITQAVDYLKKRTPARAALMIAAVWLMSALVCIPPLLGWRVSRPPEEFPQCKHHQEDNKENLEFIVEKNMKDDGNNDFVIEGRRIVSLKYFIESLQKISAHSQGSLDCNFYNLKCIGEYRKGFVSKLYFRCEICNAEFSVPTDNPNSTYDTNHGIVSGIVSIGCGETNLTELVASVNIPSMSTTLYQKVSKNVNDWFKKTALEEMTTAAKLEAEYAKEIGSVDSNGVPMITVVADACWSKRSYRNNYSANSGAAAIVGAHTGKILFLGVKNKYCTVCARAENKNEQPKPHTCYKNHTGSSSSMESAIIVEGFQHSVEMHGLMYTRLIADGDSSTYKNITTANPYPRVRVTKLECRNHLLRNLCNKARLLAKDTHYPLVDRKMLTAVKIMKLRRHIVRAIKLRKHENSTINQKMIKLRADIQNSLRHTFGDHKDCNESICPIQDRSDTDVTPELVGKALWLKLFQFVSLLASNSMSLVHDVDSNIAESFNSVIAKYTGGKRINYTLRNSYQERCTAAAVSFNTKTPITAIHERILHEIPGKYTQKYEMRKSNRKPYKKTYRKKYKGKNDDHNYGDKARRNDLDEEEYERKKSDFLAALTLNDTERDALEQRTVLQSESKEWTEQRKLRLTASKFGQICKRQDSTSCKCLVKSIVRPRNLDNVPAIKHGRKNESNAIKKLCGQENLSIRKSGLVIDKELPFVGASPDGIFTNHIGESGIVEIKCPYSAANMDPNDGIKQQKIKFWTYNKNKKTYSVNENHDWFFQIQGELHVTGYNMGILAVWTGDQFDAKVEYIKREDVFWKEKMKDKIIKFYMNCVLPELVDSRLERSMEIKEPGYILQAMKNKKDEDDRREMVKAQKSKLPRVTHIINTKNKSTSNSPKPSISESLQDSHKQNGTPDNNCVYSLASTSSANIQTKQRPVEHTGRSFYEMVYSHSDDDDDDNIPLSKLQK